MLPELCMSIKLIFQKLIRHDAHEKVQKFLYSLTRLQHVSVAGTTIVSEVQVHEPKHGCCKLFV